MENPNRFVQEIGGATLYFGDVGALKKIIDENRSIRQEESAKGQTTIGAGLRFAGLPPLAV